MNTRGCSFPCIWRWVRREEEQASEEHVIHRSRCLDFSRHPPSSSSASCPRVRPPFPGNPAHRWVVGVLWSQPRSWPRRPLPRSITKLIIFVSFELSSPLGIDPWGLTWKAQDFSLPTSFKSRALKLCKQQGKPLCRKRTSSGVQHSRGKEAGGASGETYPDLLCARGLMLFAPFLLTRSRYVCICWIRTEFRGQEATSQACISVNGSPGILCVPGPSPSSPSRQCPLSQECASAREDAHNAVLKVKCSTRPGLLLPTGKFSRVLEVQPRP